MSNWNEPLTESDMTEFALRPNLLKFIEECRLRKGLSASEMKICDWGCGRGRSVLRLRELGYDSYGADIQPYLLANARELFDARGFDSNELLKPIIDGTSAFPDSFFDFVFSEQVFEHVENLDVVARELARISSPGAEGEHTFPAQLGFVEQHLLMPFAHWFPKNFTRKYYIIFLMILGYGPDFDTTRGKKFLERAEIYYRGNIESSFYRPYRRIRNCLEKYGLMVEFVSIKHEKLRKIPGFPLIVKVPPARKVLHWFLLTFIAVALTTRKVGVASELQSEADT